jgi:dienelactone hydrolase
MLPFQDNLKEVPMNRKTLALAAALAALGCAAPAAGPQASGPIETRPVEYRHGDVLLEGYLALPKGASGRLPGVLVFHEWKGHNEYVRRRAEQLARAGYAAFAADIYGKGVTAQDHQEAARLAGLYKSDRALMRGRARAALEVLARHCDPARVVAMGYCFGGTCALELARSGAPIAGAAAFHADLGTPNPADARQIKGKIIAFHGADDPFVKDEAVLAFQKEMRDAGVDWQFVSFGGTVHSFTVPEAGHDPSKGAAYSEKADRRSWKMLLDFIAECVR